MTEEKRNALISKIMKLMELGNSERNSNSAEAEAASRKAAQLMAEYSIDFAQLRDGKKDPDNFVSMTVDGSEVKKVDYEASLAYQIAKAFDCKMINTSCKDFDNPEHSYGDWQICFVGTKNDLEIAVFFFKYLRRTIYSMARKHITTETTKPSYTSSGRRVIDVENARRNYCYGLVVTIGERLTDLYQKREEFIPSDCKAVMVIKQDGLEKAFDRLFPNRSNGRKASFKGDTSAYFRGKEAGHKVNLSRPIGNGSGPSPQIN